VKHAFLSILISLPLLNGCATDPYSGRADVSSRVMGGALVGGAVGAVGGAALGSSAVVGAAAGAVAGGAIGAATTAHVSKHRKYYRDTRGYCYFIDASGQPQYDYTVRCR
jgi:uncharacterized protein YcfJ